MRIQSFPNLIFKAHRSLPFKGLLTRPVYNPPHQQTCGELKMLNKLIRFIVLVGPLELVSLAAFLASVMVWAVTLGVMYR